MTFKIVEETVKRACLKAQMDNLMPMQIESLRNIKRTLNESPATKEVIMDKTGTSNLHVPSTMTPTKDRSPEIVNRRTQNGSIYGGAVQDDQS